MLEKCKTAFNHSSDIEFDEFIKIYKSMLSSDNPISFRNNLIKQIWKLIMKTDQRIRDKKSAISY